MNKSWIRSWLDPDIYPGTDSGFSPNRIQIRYFNLKNQKQSKSSLKCWKVQWIIRPKNYFSFFSLELEPNLLKR